MMVPNWFALEDDCDENDVKRIIEYAKVRERQIMIANEFIENAMNGEEIDWVAAMEVIKAEEVGVLE